VTKETAEINYTAYPSIIYQNVTFVYNCMTFIYNIACNIAPSCLLMIVVGFCTNSKWSSMLLLVLLLESVRRYERMTLDLHGLHWKHVQEREPCRMGDRRVFFQRWAN